MNEKTEDTFGKLTVGHGTPINPYVKNDLGLSGLSREGYASLLDRLEKLEKQNSILRECVDALLEKHS